MYATRKIAFSKKKKKKNSIFQMLFGFLISFKKYIFQMVLLV